jgi:crotonobetainyl-CoA:carnitine CoA-transferase CaiB-like acyl-CoA transferase
VRDLYEVLNNAHMKERGMLEVIDHPRLGPITVPGSPLRYHGTPQTPATPSPAIGADNVEVFAELLGLGADEVEALREDGVI